MTFRTFRSPYAEEFFEAAAPESSPLPWPSRSLKRSALPGSPCGANISTLQDSLHGTDCSFAPPSRSIAPLHHSTSPWAVEACYVALWRLPRPDFHRQVIKDARLVRPPQGTPAACWAATSSATLSRMTIKARVRAGRLLVDEATDLPDGTEIELLSLDPGDWLDEADRAALHEALRDSEADVAAGRLVDAEEILRDLRSH